MSKFNSCLRHGSVQFGDDFDAVAEVTRLFGATAKKLPFRICFKVPGQTDTIACLLSKEGGSGWHNIPEFGPNKDGKGWNEILTIADSTRPGSMSRRSCARISRKSWDSRFLGKTLHWDT